MDSKINSPAPPKRVPKGHSVLDEINRGKEYSKLLERRQLSVPINSATTGHKDTTKSAEAKDKIQTQSDPVKLDDKAKNQQIVGATQPDPAGQTPVQLNPVPVVQANKTTTTQIDQDVKTTTTQIDQDVKTSSEAKTEKVDTKPLELYQQLYPDIYVERMIVPEYQPNYDEIPRVTRPIINRDTLSLKQHMNLLAQPKVVRKRPVEPPYILRRKVPGPSPRIIQLARPKRRQTLETCNQFGATMEKFCIENCHRNVQDVTFVPVHDAVYFIELNKRQPLIEKAKLELRMKRLQDKINEAKIAKTQDVLRTLYLSLKRYLLPPPPPPPLITKKPDELAECAECAQISKQCDKCAKLQAVMDDASDDSDTDDNVDDETQKLGALLRCKMEKLLKEDKIKKGSNLDLLLRQVSGKLSTWMKKLQNSEVIEEEPEAEANEGDQIEAETDDTAGVEAETDDTTGVDVTATN